MQNRAPRTALLKRIFALLAAGSLLWAARRIVAHEDLAALLLARDFESDRHLGRGELLHYALSSMLGLPAAVLLSSAWPGPLWARVTGAVERAGYGVPAVFASAGAFFISRFITHHAWFTDDEQAYLFQADCYRHLQLIVPALQPEHLFHHQFVLVARVAHGVPYWASAYPVMQPALLALAGALGSPLLFQWLAVGGIALASGKLAERLTGERRLGLAAAWLCATSPMLLGLGATYHNAVPTCLFSILALHACLTAVRRATFVAGLALGLAAGVTFLTRPLEGTLTVTLATGALLWRARERPRSMAATLVGFASAGAGAFAIYAWVNHGTTGNPLDSTYAVWARQNGTIVGFHSGMMWGRSHSISHGLAQTFTTLTRMNAWLFGWPVSLLAPLLALIVPLQSRGALFLLGISALQLAGYFALAFGSVHDFGAAYHVWHVPLLAAVAACALQGARAAAPHAARLVPALTLVSFVIFWPPQIDKWRTLSDATLAGVQEVARVTQGKRAIVLHLGASRPGVPSWVNFPPTSYPGNAVWWAFDVPGAAEYLQRAYPDRALFRLTWEGPRAKVVALD